jgi:hypothetical protein
MGDGKEPANQTRPRTFVWSSVVANVTASTCSARRPPQNIACGDQVECDEKSIRILVETTLLDSFDFANELCLSDPTHLSRMHVSSYRHLRDANPSTIFPEPSQSPVLVLSNLELLHHIDGFQLYPIEIFSSLVQLLKCLLLVCHPTGLRIPSVRSSRSFICLVSSGGPAVQG